MAGNCLLPLLLCIAPLLGSAQVPGTGATGAEGAFHAAANHYIAGQQQEALQAVEKGLRQYPSDQKLQALHQKLKQQQEQQKNQQQQQNEQQNEKNQQSEQQQKSSAGQQSEEDLNQQGQDKDQQSEQQKQDAEQQQQREAGEGEEGEEQEMQARDPQGEINKRLQEMNISPEKAKMLLEAMKSNEIQYLQQKQRQPARRQKSDKPDW
ncbi:hypothetical protein D770_21795 [Flammeovirgaceae bacterium 311]|nr:hypothetical protein D770_21795 [Flammeovirgaceae bacterium 311]